VAADGASAAKKDEKAASTITADRIVFDNVTVITPASVLLVSNLSFTLEDFFYIPQKPYNVFGTLADQLTYPETADRTDLHNNAAKLKEILVEVDLDYLVDRPNALSSGQAWGEILSLGEKQRMQIARLIYHKPKYIPANARPHGSCMR
jgi:ABC-type uncharacterized transport system fused permease/ATPase subunit